MGGQFKNKNGNMKLDKFVKLIHSGELDQWMRDFRTSLSPCPPVELIHKDTQCFYCADCQRQCASKVKEYKNYYKADGERFEKTDLEEGD